MSTELHPKFVELAKLLDEAYDKLHLKAVIIDIDTGNFDRSYCTLQLSVYEYFLSLEGIEVEVPAQERGEQ